MSGPEVLHKAAADETWPDPQAAGQGVEVSTMRHGFWGPVETTAASVCQAFELQVCVDNIAT